MRELEMAFITTELSPSSISSVKPESAANSNAFLQAKTSASSLSETAGPLADRAAITSPPLFRITTPKNLLFLSSDSEVEDDNGAQASEDLEEVLQGIIQSLSNLKVDEDHQDKNNNAYSPWRSELSKIDDWYASFGSNMWKPRFLCYVEGGQAIPFLVGCPACLRNFLNLFCELTFSPNQSLFINVTAISKVNNNMTVDGIDFYITESFGEGLYDSCKDVKFGTMNFRAIQFIGAGAQNFKGGCW